MGLISSWINAKVNAATAQLNYKAQSDATKSQSDSVDKQIAAQKEANEQQLAFNKAEAELAFERNSSKGQLAQLLDAGLSEQQARQIIAGGSAGSYTAAPSVNQMQGVDYTAKGNLEAQQALNKGNYLAAQNSIIPSMVSENINSGAISLLSDIFDADAVKRAYSSGWSIGSNILQSSLTASDGGIIGNMTTAPLQGTLLRHINEIPAEARGSYASFCSFASSAAAPAWCKTADFQQMMQLATESPMAQKSIQSFFNTSNQLLTGEKHYEALSMDVKLKQSQERLNVVSETYKNRSLELLKSQISNTDLNNDLLVQKIESEKLEQRSILATCISQELQNSLFNDTLPYITDSTIAQLSALTSEMTLKNSWFDSGYNCQAYLDALTATAEGTAAAAALAAMNDRNTKERIEKSPCLSWLVEIHNALKGAGLQIANTASGAAGATGLMIKALKYAPK